MAEYSLFSETPQLAANADSTVNLGVAFSVSTTCWLTAIKFLTPTSGTIPARAVALYPVTGTTELFGNFNSPTPVHGQWTVAELPTPYELTPGTMYRAVVRYASGDYPATGDYFASGAGASGVTVGPLSAPSDADLQAAHGRAQMAYGYDAQIGNVGAGYQGGNYWVDVVVTDVDPAGSGPVVVSLDLSGAGTLTASGAPGFAFSVDLSGSGALTGSTSATSEAGVTLSGSGTLSAAASPSIAAIGALAGSGALTASVITTGAAGAEFSGSGSLAASVLVATAAAINLASAGTLAFTPIQTAAREAPSDSEGQLTLGLIANLSAEVGLSGDGALSADVGDRPMAEFIGTSTGTLTAVVKPAFAATALLGGAGSLTFMLELSGRDVVIKAYLADNTRRLAALPDNRWEAHL